MKSFLESPSALFEALMTNLRDAYCRAFPLSSRLQSLLLSAGRLAPARSC